MMMPQQRKTHARKINAIVTGLIVLACGTGLILLTPGNHTSAMIGAIMISTGAGICLITGLIGFRQVLKDTQPVTIATLTSTRNAWTVIQPRLDQPLTVDIIRWLNLILTDARSMRLIDEQLATSMHHYTPNTIMSSQLREQVQDAIDHTLQHYTLTHVRFALATGSIPTFTFNQHVINQLISKD